ncbi:hypothetical protein [Rhizobium sp. NXC14]|uniref:hypothetical protein n=1 Tax=Rhizobium sp. NXC14 TaxID=1981173 RepID=UPI000A270868|nr:hypothetical protein [Rhizobium sp. NXC14]
MAKFAVLSIVVVDKDALSTALPEIARAAAGLRIYHANKTICAEPLSDVVKYNVAIGFLAFGHGRHNPKAAMAFERECLSASKPRAARFSDFDDTQVLDLQLGWHDLCLSDLNTAGTRASGIARGEALMPGDEKHSL